MRIAITLAITLALAATSAVAQDAASLAIYQQLDARYPAPSGEPLQTALTTAVARFAATEQSCTPTSVPVARIAVASADQIVIRQIVGAHAHNGWTVLASPAGCADDAPLDFLVVERADGALDAVVFSVGNTLAWPSLTRDSQVAAMLTADHSLPADGLCGKAPLRRSGSTIIARGSDLATLSYGVVFRGRWRESWVFTRCGKTISVPIDFTADGNGGADYHIDMTHRTDSAIN